jgi:ParB/RepB/Spo0J family partition protein
MTDPIHAILLVPLTDIEVPEGWNARSGAWHENVADPTSDDGGFEGLKASMGAKGVNDTPILLRPKHLAYYVLVDGFRRVRAARELGWTTVRAIVEDMSDFEARRRNIQAQTSHERLKPADLAWAVADLKRLGGPKLTDNELGALVGISGVYAGVLRRIMQDVDERVTRAWRASAVRVEPAELQKLTVMPREQHWARWEETLLDKQTRPHGSTRATAFLRLKSKCREKGFELGVLDHLGIVELKPVVTADWIAAVFELFIVPPSTMPKEQNELAEAMRDGYHEGLSRTLKKETP